jgi:hypothetical protein
LLEVLGFETYSFDQPALGLVIDLLEDLGFETGSPGPGMGFLVLGSFGLEMYTGGLGQLSVWLIGFGRKGKGGRAV